MLEEKLERKEYFLQLKEKKWGELEKLLEEFAIEDDELKERLADLRIYVLPTTKLSNVVTENDELHNDLAKSNMEINKLRNIFLDPFARKKLKPKNKECTSKISNDKLSDENP